MQAKEVLEIHMMTDDDTTLEEWFAVLKSTESESQAQGQREIAGLLTAVGVRGVDDEKDLIGMRLKLVKCGKRVKEFLPAPEALAA
jgi:hypothetical protein